VKALDCAECHDTLKYAGVGSILREKRSAHGWEEEGHGQERHVLRRVSGGAHGFRCGRRLRRRHRPAARLHQRTGNGTINGFEGHFRSDFFGFPDWTPVSDPGILGSPSDFAFRFEANVYPAPATVGLLGLGCLAGRRRRLH
jgi:hypothetical protein